MDSRTARIVAEELAIAAVSAGSTDLRYLGKAYARIATRLEREEAKAKEAGPFTPFKAWVVVDKNGSFSSSEYCKEIEAAQDEASYQDTEYPALGPHRVVPVLVTPVKED